MSKKRLFNVMLEENMYNQLIDLAGKNNRAMSEEARHAFLRHLASPPKLAGTQAEPLGEVHYVAGKRTGRRPTKTPGPVS